ncbi:MAG: transcriptional regulator FNR, partial [Gammaproteobacteria bacterium]
MHPSGIIDISTLRKSCSDCSLQELCLPRGLGRQALEQLEKVVKRTLTLQNGENLFHTNDEFKYIYA